MKMFEGQTLDPMIPPDGFAPVRKDALLQRIPADTPVENTPVGIKTGNKISQTGATLTVGEKRTRTKP